ncbi:hypothetical protein [Evansella tamaricis]|uniref:Uncharacterized protein n=1 Tax=Evansella tamaricis TaxID=2069301 RepID=A0ABS6JGV3_9BACI|nr:hypothetical protein [Evansella tamaricis]MBU9712826.1 hypothetical protein [Evansella tamaricis]
MITNDKGLIYLDKQTMSAIFNCVYGVSENLKPETKKLLQDKQFHDFIDVLLALQEFNYRYRFAQTAELLPLFERSLGPMERNSEGTTLWLALGLALKDWYGLRRETLSSLLDLIGSELRI